MKKEKKKKRERERYKNAIKVLQIKK